MKAHRIRIALLAMVSLLLVSQRFSLGDGISQARVMSLPLTRLLKRLGGEASPKRPDDLPASRLGADERFEDLLITPALYVTLESWRRGQKAKDSPIIAVDLRWGYTRGHCGARASGAASFDVALTRDGTIDPLADADGVRIRVAADSFIRIRGGFFGTAPNHATPEWDYVGGSEQGAYLYVHDVLLVEGGGIYFHGGKFVLEMSMAKDEGPSLVCPDNANH